MSGFTTGFIIAFAINAELTGVMIATLPFLAGAGALIA
jgi:hypothetical protein